MSTAPGFTVLIPARLRSSRLPNKPLADIHGIPMVVRVAQQAQKCSATSVVVACDDRLIIEACAAFDVVAIMTRVDHLSGSDRLAEACDILALPDDHLVVNVQGDEPLISPLLIDSVAVTLANRLDCVMSSAAHAIEHFEEFVSPNVVKVVLDNRQTALYFSRAPIPTDRDNMGAEWWKSGTFAQAPLRHIGIYGYRASFLRKFPHLSPSTAELLESLEQLRVLWHGYRIAIHITTQPSGTGVDTLQDLERARFLLA